MTSAPLKWYQRWPFVIARTALTVAIAIAAFVFFPEPGRFIVSGLLLASAALLLFGTIAVRRQTRG